MNNKVYQLRQLCIDQYTELWDMPNDLLYLALVKTPIVYGEYIIF